MFNEKLNKVFEDWLQNYSDMQYILVIENEEKELLVSYAKNDYTLLLEPYDINPSVDTEKFAPKEVIKHEISDGETGYIYKLNDDKTISLLARLSK